MTKSTHEIYNQVITLKSITLKVLDLPQKEKFMSGIGVRNSRQALIIEWEDLKGVKGYGECSCRTDPYYSHEFTAGAILLIEQFILPFLAQEQTFGELIRLFEKIRGWNFTKAALETAAMQVIEQNTSISPFEKIKNTPVSKVPVGISIGLYRDLTEIESVVENAINLGYKRLKFKISPQVRTDLFDSLHSKLNDSGVIISFDGNGSMDESNLEILGYFIEKFNAVIEQPFNPEKFELLTKARKKYPELKICFDEEIKSIGDLIKLHQLDLLDEVNLKPGRVGGIMKSLEIINYCAQQNIPCWIGGMFETGIGRISNLRLASYLPEAGAHDLSPSDRYFHEDIISPSIQMNNGFVEVDSLQDCQIERSIVDKYTIKSKNVAIP